MILRENAILIRRNVHYLSPIEWKKYLLSEKKNIVTPFGFSPHPKAILTHNFCEKKESTKPKTWFILENILFCSKNLKIEFPHGILRYPPRGNVPTHSQLFTKVMGEEIFCRLFCARIKSNAQRDIFSYTHICGEFSFSLRRSFVHSSWIFTPTLIRQKRK